MNTLKLPSYDIAIYAQGLPSAKKLALVLPGKLDTKNYPHMRSHVDYLAEKGYLALSFDPPGTWESPGDIELYTMNNYLLAIQELITHFDNRPTVVLGHSRGGGMATLAGMQNKSVTHFISIMGGAYPSDAWIKVDSKPSRRDMPMTNPVMYKEFTMPHAFMDAGEVKDLSNDFENCTKPKLFILGTKDELITPEEVQSFYEKFANPKELYELDCGHDYRRYPDKIEEVNNVIGTFLATYSI